MRENVTGEESELWIGIANAELKVDVIPYLIEARLMSLRKSWFFQRAGNRPKARMVLRTITIVQRDKCNGHFRLHPDEQPGHLRLEAFRVHLDRDPRLLTSAMTGIGLTTATHILRMTAAKAVFPAIEWLNCRLKANTYESLPSKPLERLPLHLNIPSVGNER
ncbi:hypothetical protein HKX48_006156 [Thoreauomyces humboldtii]|nr:hypothetical protein HKX48_006156 [Thoreauomyces humboldtii]